MGVSVQERLSGAEDSPSKPLATMVGALTMTPSLPVPVRFRSNVGQTVPAVQPPVATAFLSNACQHQLDHLQGTVNSWRESPLKPSGTRQLFRENGCANCNRLCDGSGLWMCVCGDRNWCYEDVPCSCKLSEEKSIGSRWSR
jgi:hypothetical protein